MNSVFIKVYFSGILFISTIFNCKAQSATLKDIYPDNGLIYEIDGYADSVLSRKNYPFISLIAISRYSQSGLLLWNDNTKLLARKFFFKKGKWKVKKVSKRLIDSAKIGEIFKSGCDYSVMSTNERSKISHDFVFRLRTKQQMVYFWFSNYLAKKDSCSENLKYLMELGF